ncbi:porin [Trinickia terrae]|uniref:Porin n=1 Tax=Trinickia terrae TaxID=2571161 RepID=A0A4U1I4S5_9BURK|nr:porin [Trinickia terrae]TKC88284.1 porin [Trinickia terrae]
MKKTFISAAVAAMGVCGVLPAHAQSSVTMYGLISTGVGYVSNAGGAKEYALYSGTNQNNRWGFRVREDLGGGLAAVAQLESGFDITTGNLGQNGRMFGRQAWVGLQSNTLGTVTFGRQYDAFFDYIAQFSAPYASGGLAAHPGDSDNLMGSWRYNNSIKYATPVWNGFSAEALYAMSNSTDFALNRAWSTGVRYTGNRFSVAAAYVEIQRPGTTNANGAVTNDYSGAPFWLFRTSPLNSAVGVQRQRNIGAGGNYRVTDKATLSAFVDDIRYDYLDHSSLHLNNYDVSFSYLLTPALSVAASYVYTHGTYGGLEANPHWNTGQITVDYALSKRTDVYVFDDYQRVSGPHAAADIFLNAPSTSKSQNLVVAGIRHKF